MTAVGDPLLDCEGEMAERLAAYDWSTSPLGPLDSWSQSLRTSVAIVLRSRYPMLLSWGEDLVMLYNDAFIPTLGTKHPDAFGGLLPQEFAEVWDAIGQMQLSVLAGGQATWFEDLRLMIERGAGLEEAFFTFSYSHVPDESGTGGVLAVLTVTTDKVVAARRLALLNQLAMVGTQAAAPDQAMSAALAVLAGASEDLCCGALYAEGLVSADEPPGLFRTGSFGEPDDVEVPDLVDSPEHPVSVAWSQRRPSLPPPTRRDPVAGSPVHWAAFPLRGQDDVEAVLLLAPQPLRPFDEDHQRFLGLIADQVAQILAVATARAREHARLEALAALDAAKTAFLSNVSHEFRTPLTLLLAPLEDVLDGRAAKIEREDAEVMHLSAHRLLRMVNALLDVARMEADGLTPSPETIDLVQTTRDLLQPFEAAAARAGLGFETDLDPELGLVLVDPELWEKIVLNLVANAIKFTTHGSVGVVLGLRGEHIVLRVTDTGTGIPESDVDKVFDRFHRVQQGGDRNVGGTGIGLTLVAEAARAMGGTATVQSAPGVGSCFEVVLGLVRAAAPPTRSDSSHLGAIQALATDASARNETGPETTYPGPLPAGTGPAILVVEDNAALGARVSRLLAGLGQVSTASDGMAALAVLRSRHIDLVVSDVMMPRMDGLELLAEIRGDQTLRSTPVILLSARAGSEAAAGAIDAGADDYVVKPFTPGELLARCRTSLELAESRATAAASQVRATLLAGVSHDMQTPLAVITSSLGLLGEPDIDEEQRRHIAARARARASQLTRLVTQFLDWSRLSMNQSLPVRLERVRVMDLLAAVAAEHERVLVTGDVEAVEVFCDQRRTEQILHNLVENAQRVARSKIEIEPSWTASEVTVRVADDGTGVSPEVLPFLFDAFGPTTASNGNGLGLHVSREAAVAQGGALVLESTGPEGTVFALTLSRQRR